MNAGSGRVWVLAGLARPLSAHNWRAALKSYGAQWAMILSGAQSALQGLVFIKQASGPTSQHCGTLPLCGFRCLLFPVSAIWLQVFDVRRRKNGVRDDLTHCPRRAPSSGRESGQLLRVGDVCGGGFTDGSRR